MVYGVRYGVRRPGVLSCYPASFCRDTQLRTLAIRRVDVLFLQQAPVLFFLIDAAADGALVFQRLGIKPVVATVGR